MRNISIFRGKEAPLPNLGSIGSYYFQELNSIPIWRKINNTTWVVVANLGAGSGGVGAIIHGNGTPQDVILDPVMGMHYINDLTADFFWYDTQWNLIGNFLGHVTWIYQNGTPLVNPPTTPFNGLQVLDEETLGVWAYDGASWLLHGYFDRTAILYGVGDPADFITTEMVYDGLLYINTESSQLWHYTTAWAYVTQLGMKILHGSGVPEAAAPSGTHYIDDTTQGLWHYTNTWVFDGYLRGVQYKRNGTDLGTNTVKSLDILVNDNADFQLSLDGETLTLDLTNLSKGFAAITSVTPLSGDNVVVNATNSDGLVLDACTVSRLTFVVHVFAMTGRNLLKPNVKLIWDNSPSGTAVPLTPHTTENLWVGQLQITLAAAGTIQVVHEDGDTDDCLINYLAPPVVTDLIFTANDYPLPNQNEYAAGREIYVTVTADQPFTHVELITGTGAATTSETFTVASGLTATVKGHTNNRTDGADYPVIARVRTAALTYSAIASSTDFVSPTGDHIRTIKLNNTLPTTSWGQITYNNGFEALKGTTETATVVLNTTNITLPTDTVSVTSPSPYDQLSIAAPNVLGNKTVTRISGGYNVTNHNLRVDVYKTSNDTSAFATTVVYIAETPQSLSVRVQKSGATNYTRLRSGGSYGSSVPQYPVLIESTQRLLGNLNRPTLDASHGAFDAAPFVGSVNNTVWTRQLLVSDLTARGAAVFSNLVTKNLAGIEVNTIDNGSLNYTIGGFVERVITFNPAPNREAPIGTSVVHVAKLRATNISRSPSHTYDASYNPLVTNDPIVGPFTYAITNNDATPSLTGTHVYSNDSAYALGNNSLDSGQWLKYEIEEQE